MYKPLQYTIAAIGTALAMNTAPAYANDAARQSLREGKSTIRMWVTEYNNEQRNTVSQGKEREVRFLPNRLSNGGLQRLEDALGKEDFARLLDNKVPRLPGSEAHQWEPPKEGVVYEEGTTPNHFYKPGQTTYERFVRFTGDKANKLFDATCHDANFADNNIKGVQNDAALGNICDYMQKRTTINGAEERKDGSWKPNIVRIRYMHLDQEFQPQIPLQKK